MSAPPVEPLLCELARLDAALEVAIARFRGRGDDLSAYYVSDTEADTLLRATSGPDPGSGPRVDEGSNPDGDPGGRPEPDREDGWPPLRLMADAFDLDDTDLDALLICLAPEVDRRYERLYGYLQDDITRRSPSVDLILNLTCLDLATKLAARARFAPSAPLVAHRLVRLSDPPAGAAVSLLDRLVRLEPRIARFLLGQGTEPETPEEWRGIVRVVRPGAEPDPHGVSRLVEAAAAGTVLLCPLSDAAHARPVAAVFAGRLGRPLLHLRADRLAGLSDPEVRLLLAETGREVRLTGSVALLDGLEELAGSPAVLDQLAGWAAGLPGPVIVAGPDEVLSSVLPWGVRVELPLNPLRARDSSRRRLRRLARLVPRRHGWSDLVLPQDKARRLRELADVARFRGKVLNEWGFGASVASGPGLNVLFAGPSGTGKTMAAQVIAGELGRDLFVVDLAAMVSKYIGETEKNLDGVFAAAHDGECVLFFDEADAMFGKRTAVKDAHDRHANLQTSYLLQKLEQQEGVVVLATNLRKNMDEAFVRRLHAVIEFPVPRVEERLRIWRQLWPAAAPVAADLDLDLLATRIDLAGGHLRNIAVGAAYLAAADGGVITMRHLEQATRREYQQLGKITASPKDGPWPGGQS
ncbi:ATP-binding protein [Rugosimonospora acidiphila]|uniref:ATP-binding protein n=1 Tax=Rugosimonospora acidiphila TaxID=556531 RepID=A0ABP9SAY3_9ACTN